MPAQVAVQNIKQGEIHYIPKRNIWEFVIGLSYANITYWSHQTSSFGWAIAVEDMDWLLFLVDQMQKSSSVNLKSLIANSSDKEVALKTHIKKIKTLLAKWNTVLPPLKTYVVNLRTEYNAYSNQKDRADAMYVQWFTDNNGSTAQEWLNTALDSWAKETEFRVKYRWYLPIVDKLTASISTLQAQYDFLIQNYAILTTNYDLLFSDGTLEELIQIRNSVQN